MMMELHAIVCGNVQAVGFRATTSSFARRLALKGIVRNKTDGTVEIIAQGEKENLEKLLAELKRVFDQIEEIHTTYSKPKTHYENFSVEI